MPLYEVAIIELPTSKESEDGKTEKLVFGPKAVIASDPQSAAISAVLEESAKSAVKLDMNKCQVLVRPFA